MSPRDRDLAQQLDEKLRSFSREEHSLRGIRASAHRKAFVEQLIDSIHRIRYVFIIRNRDVSVLRADPSSNLFDPLKAAVFHHRQRRIDEAFWLIFLSVHFGKHLRSGWRLVRDVYGQLGGAIHWDWARTSANPADFCRWLANNQARLKGGDGVVRRFGNHRKYQSLDATSPDGTGAAFESYVRWVNSSGTHELLVQEILASANGDPRRAFDALYHSMDDVVSFGRMAKFDYLTMVGKLGLASIEPGSTYMQGATGPLAGAQLLFGGNQSTAFHRRDIEEWLVQLEARLQLPFGMQVLEDALCNWQKNPAKFKRFRG